MHRKYLKKLSIMWDEYKQPKDRKMMLHVKKHLLR
jgi:hypothetical protein